MSESLVSKLLTVQKELKAPKSQFNSFGKYSYRSAEDILEAAKPLNVANGLLLTLIDEPVLIGDWHYIKATASITDGDNTHVVTAYAREEENKKGMDAMQVTGTASSYARKYALNGLYLIDDTKDADTDEYQKQSNQKPQQKSQSKPQGSQQKQQSSSQSTQQKQSIASQKQREHIARVGKEFAELRGVSLHDVLDKLEIPDLERVSPGKAGASITKLDGWLKKAQEENQSKEKQEA